MNTEKTKGKIWKRLCIAVLVVLLIAAAACGGYLLYLRSKGTFIRNTTLNGYDVSEKTPEEVLELLIDGFEKTQVTLTERGEVDLQSSLEELGFFIEKDRTMSLIEEALSIQNSNPVELANSVLRGRTIRMDVPSSVDEDVFASRVNAASLLAPRKNREDAYLAQAADGSYEIVPEVYGTEFADEDLQYEVRAGIGGQLSGESDGESALEEGKLELIFPESIYIQPEVLDTDPELNLTRDAYNQYCHAQIVYQFGSQTETLGWDTVQEWLILEDGNGRLDKDKAWAFVQDLATRYNTRYETRTFQTTYGNTVTISPGLNEYGYTVNQDAEYAQLMEDLSGNAPVSREPVYVKTNAYENPLYYHREGVDDLAGTYVEVNLSAQHLWFYKNGALITESDFVSGCVAKGHETQTGAFPLAYKKSPDVLVGSNANDGYRTQVNYWMPFYEGQGLHDATWRGSFGGNIYQSNGSHGCVNLPLSAAAVIYENIEPGMAIIIFK